MIIINIAFYELGLIEIFNAIFLRIEIVNYTRRNVILTRVESYFGSV